MNDIISYISHIRFRCKKKDVILIPDSSTKITLCPDHLLLNDEVIVDFPKGLDRIEIRETKHGKLISLHESNQIHLSTNKD